MNRPTLHSVTTAIAFTLLAASPALADTAFSEDADAEIEREIEARGEAAASNAASTALDQEFHRLELLADGPPPPRTSPASALAAHDATLPPAEFLPSNMVCARTACGRVECIVRPADSAAEPVALADNRNAPCTDFCPMPTLHPHQVNVAGCRPMERPES